MKKTDAQEFAELFYDGATWVAEDGRSFDEVMAFFGATPEYAAREKDEDGNTIFVPGGYSGNHFAGDPIRWVFDDGSVIVTSGGGWDFEGTEPFSWEGCE